MAFYVLFFSYYTVAKLPSTTQMDHKGRNVLGLLPITSFSI